MTTATIILAAIFILCGIIALAAGITGREWFFSSASSFFGLMPRPIARILAAVTGLAAIAIATTLLSDAFHQLS